MATVGDTCFGLGVPPLYLIETLHPGGYLLPHERGYIYGLAHRSAREVPAMPPTPPSKPSPPSVTVRSHPAVPWSSTGTHVIPHHSHHMTPVHAAPALAPRTAALGRGSDLTVPRLSPRSLRCALLGQEQTPGCSRSSAPELRGRLPRSRRHPLPP